MTIDVNIINQLSSASGGKSAVYAAIQKASANTGVDFSYLLAKATQESGLNPSAKATTSSATGLYQFIDQTWLKTVKQHGAEHGLDAAAEKIEIGADGIARVTNARDKRAILALRNDPEISANMAAELAKDNQASLERTVGGDIGSTELYMAHFLGAGGATAFLKTMNVSPDAKAAAILPSAAAANKNVFYDKTGRARSLSEVYALFDRKFDSAPEDGTHVASTTYSTEAESAADYALSSMGFVADSTYVGNGLRFGATASTPFAAMMLAQMDVELMGLDAMARLAGVGG